MHVISDGERDEFGKKLGRQLAVPLLTYAITCKHAAYAHERETRLLLVNDRSEVSIPRQSRGL
jgi:hypothetical protein